MANGRNRGEPVTTEIRIYVEGGGDKETKADIRRGFDAFLSEVKDRARSRRFRWSVVACGPRGQALSDFRTALRAHPKAANLLLVDAEGPVSLSPKEHLAQRDGWDMAGIDDPQCHLMVQAMEAWLVADVEALQEFYGQGFNSSAIPKTANVEAIEKARLLTSLESATRSTSKGAYHKTRHAPKLLAMLDVSKVRAAPHCERLLALLDSLLTA